MVSPELIRRIVIEVLTQGGWIQPTARPQAFILCWENSLSSECEQLIQRLQRKWEMQVFVRQSATPFPTVGVNPPYSWEEPPDDWQEMLQTSEQVLLLGADQDTLAKAALLICDTFPTCVLASAFSREKPISILPAKPLQEFMDPRLAVRSTAPYGRKLKELMDTLVSFGAKFVKSVDEFLEFPVQQGTRTAVADFHRPLLSASDLQECPSGTALHVLSSTLITPLAKDIARERGIHIRVVDEGTVEHASRYRHWEDMGNTER
jgi:hypothetical protein